MVDQDENESGNPGHTHPGASALLWEGLFIDREVSRGPLTESEEDLSSDDPEQEGADLDVRSAAKEEELDAPEPGKALKKKQDRTQTKVLKKRAMMMILCSRFRPAPMMRS